MDVVRKNIESLRGQVDIESETGTGTTISIRLPLTLAIIEGFQVRVGDVYYIVRKFSDYGKLSGQSIDHMLEAVRIEPDSKKKDPLDFALWKKSQEGEPFWESWREAAATVSGLTSSTT